MSALDGLEPAGVWARFEELTRIARPPKEEAEVREHVLSWAGERGFETAVDDEGNVVVRVPASGGRERAPTVVLQAHLDMVCERDPGSRYDPRAGRINVALEGDWVVAEETTLGADNGIGVAAALAAADDHEIAHGPLELLFTVSEEEGLVGAKNLDPSLVSGRMLLNLDGTSDKVITIGCAGSWHTVTRFRLDLEPIPEGHVVQEVVVAGARGGHSGGDIGRVNAVKALGRVLSRGYEAVPFRLASFDGGVSRNALPREARAVLALPAGTRRIFGEAAERELASVREEHAGSDDALTLSIGDAEAAAASTESTTSRALDLLATIPSGVVALNPTFPGTIETSTSLNVVATEQGVLTFGSMTRSANAPGLANVVAGVEAAARLAGARVKILRSYLPWRPDSDSRLLEVARTTFERVFETAPVLEVVHGGLECAVIGGKLPGVDMISVGPEMVGLHAPGERLNIPATQRFYRLLDALLDDLSIPADGSAGRAPRNRSA